MSKIADATARPWEIRSGIQVWKGGRLLGCFTMYSDRKEAEANVQCFVQAVNSFEAMRAALNDALEYFTDREDADHNGINFVPNKEMQMAIDIRQALKLSGEDNAD